MSTRLNLHRCATLLQSFSLSRGSVAKRPVISVGCGLRPRRILGILIAVASLAVGCKDSTSEPPPPVVATPVDGATAAQVTVRVRYDGAVPEPKPINMGSTPGCAGLHPEPVFDRTLVVVDGNLANAVVWIKDGLQGWVFAPPAQAAKLDQKGCLYVPRVAAAMVGQGVEFVNSDPEAHNVHGRPAVVSGWNFMMSRQGSERTLYFDKPEMGIQVGCDIHPWMRAYLCVLPNPYFGVTGNDGLVSLKNVPPGEYTIGVWHESLGTLEQRVTLTPKAEVAVEMGFRK